MSDLPGGGDQCDRVEQGAMQSNREMVSPRLVVAGLWISSMVISWAGGALLIGFDSGTTLIWLVLAVLGPLLVWGFVAAAQTQAPTESRRR